MKRFGKFCETIFTQKEWFLSKKEPKEGDWREVTFMKEWVKPLYIGYDQALELPKNLFAELPRRPGNDQIWV